MKFQGKNVATKAATSLKFPAGVIKLAGRFDQRGETGDASVFASDLQVILENAKNIRGS